MLKQNTDFINTFLDRPKLDPNDEIRRRANKQQLVEERQDTIMSIDPNHYNYLLEQGFIAQADPSLDLGDNYYNFEEYHDGSTRLY